jgi:hypothetical protein
MVVGGAGHDGHPSFDVRREFQRCLGNRARIVSCSADDGFDRERGA